MTVRLPFAKLKTPSARPLQRPYTRKLDEFTVAVCTGRSNLTLTSVLGLTVTRLRGGLDATICISPKATPLSSADAQAAASRHVNTRTPTGCDAALWLMACWLRRVNGTVTTFPDTNLRRAVAPWGAPAT